MVGLVNEDGYPLGQAIQELLDLLLRNDEAGRVVRIAEIDEADVLAVFLCGSAALREMSTHDD